MTKQTTAALAVLPHWQLRMRILTYLGTPKNTDANERVESPLNELGEFYVAVGNLLRALTPLIEKPDEAAPIGRQDTLRDLWPWYRERGLAVLDQARTTRPIHDARTDAIIEEIASLRSALQNRLNSLPA